MIKKTILALAVATLGTTAFAQESNVTIYGNVAASVERVTVSNSTGSENGHANQRVADQTSYIGFKGQEALGNGLKAVWQIETGFDVSGNSGSSLASGNTSSGIGTRNTYLGLNGTFGTALVGRYETPYRLATKQFDPFSATTGDAHAIMGKLGGGHYNDAFDLYMRASNVVAYVSPTWNGLTGSVAYATNEDKAQNNLGVNTANTSAWSANVVYQANGFVGTLAAEQRNQAQGGWDGKVRGIKAGVGYSYAPGATVGLVYEQLKADDVGTIGALDKRAAYSLSVAHPINNFVLKAEYSHANNYKDETGSLSNTGASLYALGADYNLSKRTSLFAHYVHLNNQSAANYNFASSATTTGLTAGADASVLGLGVRHSF